MKRITLFIISILFVASNSLAATVKENYDAACQKAEKLLEQWKLDSECITNLRSTYKSLQTAYTNYGPEAVDQTDEAAMKTATSKLNTACNSLTSKAESTKNDGLKVSKTKFDPNFHIYLCFGQSNMEGNATPELEDYSHSSKRFLTMAAVNMSSPNRTKGSWYVARPPLCRQGNGLTPADWFGKTLAENLPDSITVGVINVALGGCAIEMFMEDKLSTYLPTCADWLKNYAKNYNDNPYRYLINCAKEAQKVGVIKGILLHQGCSNNTQQDWPDKVKLIYQRMLRDLDLIQSDCPLIVGELLSQAQGGVCYGHNSVIATVPGKIENSYIASSKDCPGASDGLHFTAKGYRMIGTNYANVMLNCYKRYMKDDSHSVKSLKAKEASINLPGCSVHPLYITLTDAEGKTHDVTASCDYTFSQEGVVSVEGVNLVTSTSAGDVTVTATYTNAEGEQVSTEFQVSTSLFSLLKGCVNTNILKTTGTYTVTTTSNRLKLDKGGMGGWYFQKPLNLSDYQYLVVNLKSTSAAKPELRIYDVNNPEATSYFSVSMTGQTQAIVDLKAMKDASGKTINPSHIYIVGFYATVSNAIMIDDVYATNDDPTALDLIHTEVGQPSAATFDLTGRRVRSPQQGLYIKDGRVILR